MRKKNLQLLDKIGAKWAETHIVFITTDLRDTAHCFLDHPDVSFNVALLLNVRTVNMCTYRRRETSYQHRVLYQKKCVQMVE